MGRFRQAYIYLDQLLEDAARLKALVLFWLCLSPVLLIIPLTVRSFLHSKALNDPAKQAVVQGTVLRTKRGRGEEVAQYEFDVNGRTYTSIGAIGPANPYSSVDWDPTVKGDPSIEIKYLRSDPSINVPNNDLYDHYVFGDLFGLLIGGALGAGWISIGRGIRRLMISDRLLRTRVRTE
jgi:hypothetical protein